MNDTAYVLRFGNGRFFAGFMADGRVKSSRRLCSAVFWGPGAFQKIHSVEKICRERKKPVSRVIVSIGRGVI